jgi:hypothetical protein
MNGQPKPSHEKLAQEASEQRARLAATLDELKRRLHNLFDVKLQLRQHALSLALAGTSALLLIGGAISLVSYRKRQRRRHLYRERWRALKRLWEHPERIG